VHEEKLMASPQAADWIPRQARSFALRWGLGPLLVTSASVLARTFVLYGLPQPFTGFALSAIAITFRYGGTHPGIFTTLIAWLVGDRLFEPAISAQSRLVYGLAFVALALVMALVTRGRNAPAVDQGTRNEQLPSFGTAQLVGTNPDVTELKRVEQALRESEAKFRDYAETASDWFWEIGPDYKITLMTENAFGSRRAYQIGTACWDHALDLETEPEKWRALRVALDSRQPFRDFVYCSAGSDGSPLYVRTSGKPVLGADGQFHGYRGTGTDVTAIIRAQEEHERLRELEAHLAHMNRVCVMGELAASLVHEITQPIASARNNARAAMNFLDRDPPDLGQVREALTYLVGDADRAGRIIEWVRGHVKKAPPRQDRFDLNDAIKDVIVLARTAIHKNGIAVHTRLTETALIVEGDRVQLQQVALNLILNAIEAMSSVTTGARDLLISTEQSKPDAVLVAVRDSGPGIDRKDLERVFETFYTTKSSGVGMGLSISRSIVAAHGGRLWAEVNAPRGAVFRLTLPVAANDSPILLGRPTGPEGRGRTSQ
jgi:signal transduction histidine kinase